MLTRKLDSPVGVLRDDDDIIFLDRSGKLFAFVLEYLRTGHLSSVPDYLYDAVVAELDYLAIVFVEDGGVSDETLLDLMSDVRERQRDEVNPALYLAKPAQKIILAVQKDLMADASAGQLVRGRGSVVFVFRTVPMQLRKFESASRLLDGAVSFLVQNASNDKAWPYEVQKWVKQPFIDSRGVNRSWDPSDPCDDKQLSFVPVDGGQFFVCQVLRKPSQTSGKGKWPSS